jgi:hypothetical protein
MTDETYIFFRLHSPEFYSFVQNSLDEARGYPDGLTQQSLRDYDDLETDVDGTRYLLIDLWRITPSDEALITEAVSLGAADVILMEEYEAALASKYPDIDFIDFIEEYEPQQ